MKIKEMLKEVFEVLLIFGAVGLFIAIPSLEYWALGPTVIVEAKVLSSSCLTSISTGTFVRGVRTSARKNYYSYVEVEFPDGTKSTLDPLSSPGEYGGRLKVGDKIKVGRFGERGSVFFLFDDDFNKDLLSRRETNCQSE